MARGPVVKEEKDSSSQGGSAGTGESKTSKRRCVQSACVPCRKRKSKCDGGTPVCATCTAVYKTPCFYDAESESRRSRAGTKRDSSSVAAPSTSSSTTTTTTASTSSASSDAASANASFLINTIRNLPEADAHELVQHIRKDARLDLSALADAWRKTVTLPPAAPMEPQSLESELSMLLGKPAMTQSGETRYFGHTSAMSLVPEDENYTCPQRQPSATDRCSTWTTVTNDLPFVERLLDLYFRWSHPFYVVFSRECFYKDFRSGREKYCSPLLVNAILSYACHFSDEPAARTDPDNFRTAGDHFFDEARRLLYEDENSSLTTVQALCVMAMREPSAGRDSTGFMYMGRCMRMAIEMGLHLKNTPSPAMRLTPSEVEVRKVTFWGCFTVDTVWSICIGRISQLPRAAITLDKPILDETPAGLHPEAYPGASQVPPGTVTSRMFLQEFSTLSELINDNNFMFYAPNPRMTDVRLVNCHNKYLEWYKNLPQVLSLEGVREPQPHIIVLHMLYHTAIAHLFRPLLKIDFINFKLKPRDACIQAANRVAELFRLYRQHYPMRACQLVLTHILLSSCIVHLVFSKDPNHASTSHRNLVEGLKGLEDLSTCHWFGARAFKILYETAQAWDLPFPEEMKESNLIPSPSASSMKDAVKGTHAGPHIASALAGRMQHGLAYSPVNSDRRESLSMFARPERNMSLPSHPAAATSGQGASVLSSQPHHRAPHPQVVPSYPPTSAATPQTLAPSHTSLPTSSAAESLFWNPLPHMGGIGVPILPRNSYPVGAMDLDNMLGEVDGWDRFSRDGFKMSDTWSQDQHVHPYSTPPPHHHGEGGYAAAPPGTGSGSDAGPYAHAHAAHYSQGGEMGHTGGQAFDGGWWGGEGGMER